MSELKPCPFCGGEADEYEGDYGNGIYCMMCGAMVGEPIHLEYRTTKRVSIIEAIDAWNARAVESASGLVYIPSFRDNGKFPEHIWASLGGETAAYFRERTCHQVNIGGYSFRFECSACGYVAIVHNCAVRLDELPNWCPNCGARVEVEE